MLKKVVCGAGGASGVSKKEKKKPLLKKLLGERKNRPHESTAVNKSGYPE